MIDFLKHKKFIFPACLVLLFCICIELFLRSGLYNPMLDVKSHLGNTINRVEQMEKFGLSEVHWITLGDSKTDWGLNHKKIKDHQLTNGINHLRMSFGGSSFFSVHTAAEWSISHLPNLEGIMLGIYENELLNYGDDKKEYKISWPFRSYWLFEKFAYFAKQSAGNQLFSYFALTHYLPDIKQFLKNPAKRINKLKKQKQVGFEVFKYHNQTLNDNTCDFNLSDLSHCVSSFENLKNKTLVPNNYHIPYVNCTSKSAKSRLKNHRLKTPEIKIEAFKKKWEHMFDKIIAQDKQLTLVLLPEHTFYEYMRKPANSSDLVDYLLAKYQNNELFKVIDLRNLFDPQSECQYYHDVLHFNSRGIEKVTDAVIAALKNVKTDPNSN